MTEKRVTITMDREKAEDLSHGLSDLLCWCQGYMAGRAGEYDSHAPMGVEETRDVNIAFKKALREDQAPAPTPAPEDREGGRVADGVKWPEEASAEFIGDRRAAGSNACLRECQRAHAEALAAAPAETDAPAAPPVEPLPGRECIKRHGLKPGDRALCVSSRRPAFWTPGETYEVVLFDCLRDNEGDAIPGTAARFIPAPAPTPAPADDGGPAALTDAEVLRRAVEVLDRHDADLLALSVRNAAAEIAREADRLDASREEGR